MNRNRSCASRALWAIATALALLVQPAAARAGTAASQIRGVVVDASDGAAIPGVTVAETHGSLTTRTDAAGRFRLGPLGPGAYSLSLSAAGYQPAVSETIVVGGTARSVTLAMHRASGDLHVISTTAVTASQSLEQASTFTKTLDDETLQRQGIVRAADALRTLPGVNNGIAGDTAAMADDVQLSIRGIGTLETVAAIDGHPIAYGIKGGYNYQLSPVYPYRNVSVLYGSGGSDLLGVNAIGGVVNFQTLDPTPASHFTLTQGFGTFDQLSTSLTSTGTAGRLGYAMAYGVGGLDGPFDNDTFYQAGAAFDQSVASGPVHQLGVYTDDSGASTRAGLAKFVYTFTPQSSLSLTSVSQNRWVNKTGNGDGDYLDYLPALAFGNQLLAAYTPSQFPKLPACPKGTFVATNANGAPNGYGPNGKPDGGLTCQTPQQYAVFNTGWDGAGPAWQSLRLNDDALAYRYDGTHDVVNAQVFDSSYDNLVDRTFQLPFFSAPGDDASWSDIGVNETGAIVSDDLPGQNDDVGFGASYLNSAYDTFQNGSLKGAPVVTDTAYFLRDVYHPRRTRFTAFANLWAKHSTATDTSYLDSRLATVYRLTNRDALRASVGSTTTQPSANMIGQQFVESFSQGAGGGAPISCSALNTIGSAPSTLLRPEDGVDEDVAIVHRWQDDTQAQLTLYNTNVYDKLYSTIVPLSSTGTAFIPSAFLAQATAAVAGKCGAALAPSLLGVTGNFNVGTLRAQGADLSGRVRATRSLFFDYDWALTSTILVGANQSLLQKSMTLVPGTQLAHLPLHTFNGSVDYTFGRGLDARYTLYTVSTDNTKSLPAYDYSDLRVGYPIGRGVATATVLNLFNQWASIAGLRYEGVPLPLNGYAKPSDYAPYIGADATEQFGLPYRTIYFSYQMNL